MQLTKTCVSIVVDLMYINARFVTNWKIDKEILICRNPDRNLIGTISSVARNPVAWLCVRACFCPIFVIWKHVYVR